MRVPATWAAMRGVSLYDIADVLGDDYKTVEKYQPEFLRGAVEWVHDPAAGRRNGRRLKT